MTGQLLAVDEAVAAEVEHVEAEPQLLVHGPAAAHGQAAQELVPVDHAVAVDVEDAENLLAQHARVVEVLGEGVPVDAVLRALLAGVGGGRADAAERVEGGVQLGELGFVEELDGLAHALGQLGADVAHDG